MSAIISPLTVFRVFLTLSITVSFFLVVSPARALDYNGGTYTNLCGTGLAATHNSCNNGCNTSTGTCTSSNATVVKFTCNGRTTDCRDAESTWSTTHSVGNPGCGKTVQIDVFTQNCRVNGEWVCFNDNQLRDYLVWYSGDCPAPSPSPNPTPSVRPSPSPSPTPTHRSRCEDLTVAGGQNSQVPAKVTLRAHATDNQGEIQRYKFYFGDGKVEESSSPEIQHTYESSGSFVARVDAKDSQGKWITGNSCEATVRVTSSPVETQRSGCSDVFITTTNNAPAPTNVQFKVTGYDNKGELQQYKLDFGNGVTKESTGQTFEQYYERAGTYTIKGHIKDSQGNWKGGENGCQKTLYVTTKPLTSQPKTGTPTLFSIIGVTSSLGGIALHALKRKLA